MRQAEDLASTACWLAACPSWNDDELFASRQRDVHATEQEARLHWELGPNDAIGTRFNANALLKEEVPQSMSLFRGEQYATLISSIPGSTSSRQKEFPVVRFESLKLRKQRLHFIVLRGHRGPVALVVWSLALHARSVIVRLPAVDDA